MKHISLIILNDFLLKFNFYNKQHFYICYLFINQINAILQFQLLLYVYERELCDFRIFILLRSCLETNQSACVTRMFDL